MWVGKPGLLPSIAGCSLVYYWQEYLVLCASISKSANRDDNGTYCIRTTYNWVVITIK
jgi:hypothetical protein